MRTTKENFRMKTTGNYFGDCPECGGNDGYVNYGREHWFSCREHRTRWCAGSNLFSSWKYETEEEQEQQWSEIAEYREVEPIFDDTEGEASVGLAEESTEEMLRMETTEDIGSCADCGDSDGNVKRTDSWWWLAVNGASCAASSAPLPSNIIVSPTPEQLLGFRSRDDQIAAQKLLLNAPMEEVDRFMEALAPKVKSGEVAYVRPEAPEPPTKGPTAWLVIPD